MILILICALLASVGLLLVLRGVRRNRLGISPAAAPLRQVDLQAFCNLVDPHEEQYLRQSLSGSEFNSLHRDRMRAAADYVRDTVHNTGILLQVGQAAAIDANPEVAAAGRQLVETAFKLRTYAALALVKIYLRIVFPDAPFSGERLAERYQQLSALAGRVVRLQKPVSSPNLPLAV